MLFLYGLITGLVVGLPGGWALCRHRRDMAQEIKDHVNRL